MTKLQINLTKEANKNVELYRTLHDLKTKADAAVEMLELFKLDVKMSK
jgi:hypothetical protein